MPPAAPRQPTGPKIPPLPPTDRDEPPNPPTGLEGSRIPADDAGGTAEIMMAKLRGEEISPLRAWSRLEGWTGTAESASLPVDEVQPKDDDFPEWGPLEEPDQARWRRHLHIAVTVSGILLLTSVSGVFAATRPQTPLVTASAAAEEPAAEEEPAVEETADEAAADESADAAVVEPAAPAEISAPSAVVLADSLGNVELNWTDNSGGTASFFVMGGPSGHAPATLARTGPGVVSAQVVTDNTTMEYCFTVVAVEGSAAPAAEVCTTRAADLAEAEAERLAEEEAAEEAAEEEEAEPSEEPSPPPEEEPAG